MACTSFPGVYVSYGDVVEIGYPMCGCEDCKEVELPESEAERLEADVMAFVGGTFTAYENSEGRTGYHVEYLDDRGRSVGAGASTPAGELREHRWDPWPSR